MGDKAKIFGTYLILIVILILFGTICNAQTIITDKTFYKTQVGITVVEFYAEWNKSNKCDWIKEIKNVKAYRIDLESKSAQDYNITVLPTLLVFNNGEVVERVEGNIKFRLCPKSTPKKIKKTIKNIINEYIE